MLVTNGETRPALAITRSLGRLGHEVTVVADRHPSLASASRYCASREACPDPQLDPDGYAGAIVEMVARRRIELLLPVNEIATRLVAEHRQRLPTGCVLTLPSDESLDVANDKARVLELAARLGVPTPRSTSVDAGQSPPPDAAFPTVVKPSRSRVRSLAGWLSGGTEYAVDAGDLARRLGAMPPALFPVLLQERIHGEGVGIFACYWRGRPVAFFSHRRLREKPPSGGVSVLCESIPLDPVAAGHAERLLSALDWHGVAMVEFKRDERDGSLRLMEINGRFWGSLQLAIDSGVDFPAIVARLVAGVAVALIREYRIGVRSRWFLGDLDALFALWTRSPAELRLPPGHPGRWRTLRDFLAIRRPDQRSEILRREDLRPGFFEFRQWLGGG